MARVRVEETLKIKIGEAKNISSHRDTYCAVALDTEQIFSTHTVNKSSNPFYGEEFQCEVPRKFRFLNFYLYEKLHKQDKIIGKVGVKKDELQRYYGREHWFPLQPVHSSSEVQGKVHIEVKFHHCNHHLTKSSGLRPCKVSVRVLECDDLTVTNGQCNPYAVVSVHRVRGSKHKDDVRRTAVKRKTLCPMYNESFQFELDKKHPNHDVMTDYSNLELSVSLWHDDSRMSREMFGKNIFSQGVFLGEMKIPINDLDPTKSYKAWHFLQPRSSHLSDLSLGSLRVRICYMADHVFESHHYEQLRSLLLESPNITPVTSSAAYLMGEIVDMKEEVAQPIVRIFHNRGMVVSLIAKLADWEIANTVDANTIFRGNTLASKCIDELMKLVGLHYLQDTLKAIIDEIFSEKKTCEIDPTRIKEGENVTLNMKNLEQYVERIFEAIVYSGLNCPLLMCEVYSALKESAVRHFPNNKEVRYQVVSGFVFLRFFAPAILGPKLFQLRTDTPDPVVHRTLTLVSKAIQGLGNIVSTKTHAFGFKEDYMRPLFTHFMDEKHLGPARTFLDIISSLTRMASTSIEAPIVLKEGWLTKRAQGRRKYGIKNFKKRFFRLTNHGLSYAKSEGKPTLCEIPIEDILAVEDLQEDTFTRKYMFQVIQPRRALYMQASNCVEERQWKHILNKVCQMNKKRLKVYHPGGYIKGHWLCCKRSENSAEGCTPVTGALPATISLEVDEDREMERLHYLVMGSLPRLDRLSELIQQQQDIDSSDEMGKERGDSNKWKSSEHINRDSPRSLPEQSTPSKNEFIAPTNSESTRQQRTPLVTFHIVTEEDSGVSSQIDDINADLDIDSRSTGNKYDEESNTDSTVFQQVVPNTEAELPQSTDTAVPHLSISRVDSGLGSQTVKDVNQHVCDKSAVSTNNMDSTLIEEDTLICTDKASLSDAKSNECKEKINEDDLTVIRDSKMDIESKTESTCVHSESAINQSPSENVVTFIDNSSDSLNDKTKNISFSKEDTKQQLSCETDVKNHEEDNNNHVISLVKSSRSEPVSIVNQTHILDDVPVTVIGGSCDTIGASSLNTNSNLSIDIRNKPLDIIRGSYDAFRKVNGRSDSLSVSPSSRRKSDVIRPGGIPVTFIGGSCDTLARSCESLQVQMLGDLQGSFKTLQDLRRCSRDLQMQHQVYFNETQRMAVLGSQEFPFGDDGYLNLYQTKL